jgi:hypothetical protein
MGAHRKAVGVLVPVQVYEELRGERERAVDDVAGSLRAEGLEPSPVASELADALWRAGSRRDRWKPCCSPTTARHDGCRSVCRR